MNSESFVAVMSGADKSLGASAIRGVARCAEPVYLTIVQARNLTFNREWRKAARLARTTISVGNITTGGTGKTPMVAALAKRLIDMGHQPAVLMRGYMPDGKHDDEGSDERAVLVGELSGLAKPVPVCCDPNRTKAAKAALAEQPDVGVFILDDGFQHRQVFRDLDLVLIDATRPFGFGRVLPRGLLREPLRNLRRAHGIILTRANQVGEGRREELIAEIRAAAGQPPIALAAHAWRGLRTANGVASVDILKGKRVNAVTGIGNPRAFRQSIEQRGGEVVEMHAYDDHHAFTADEVQAAYDAAVQQKVDGLFLTEKDFVKWARHNVRVPEGLSVVRPVLEMAFLTGEEQVVRLMSAAMRPGSEFKNRRTFQQPSDD